jgi:ELWxxDGT repeat protein
VRDIHPRPTCPAYWLTDVQGTLYFNAGDGRHGEELWRSDGTPTGTTLVKDVWPGPAEFPASDEFCQYGPQFLTGLGDAIYFVSTEPTYGAELWTSDGTAPGTRLVADIRPGDDDYGFPYGSSPRELTPVSGRLFFAADDGTHGLELWVTG